MTYTLFGSVHPWGLLLIRVNSEFHKKLNWTSHFSSRPLEFGGLKFRGMIDEADDLDELLSWWFKKDFNFLVGEVSLSRLDETLLGQPPAHV